MIEKETVNPGLDSYVIVIGGRKLSISPKLWHVRYAFKKFDLANVSEWSLTKYDSYIIHMLWMMVNPDRFGFIKPYVFRWRLSKALLINEMKRIRIDVQRIILGREPMSDEEYKEMLEEDRAAEDKKAEELLQQSDDASKKK